jgi:hypothetical protein
VSDELLKCYELLGVAPGTNGPELKQAYLDLAKVWHPDRFTHDPRLQQKAQEKLKEINEAYERLKTGRAPRPAPPTNSYKPRAAAGRRRPRFILFASIIFCAAFAAALSQFVGSSGWRARPQTPAAGREEARPAKEGAQPDVEASPSAGQSRRGNERAGRRTAAENAEAAPAATPDRVTADAPGAQTLRPMPTVTVSVDAVSGLLATEDCPTVIRMTYPAGDEPKKFCTTQHRTKINVPAEPPRPKDSRLKSIFSFRRN